MRRLIASALICVVATGIALAPNLGRAQDLPQPPVGFQPPPPPPPPPVRPYNPVSVTPAGTFNDPSYATFRANLADVAKKKDRAGLANLVVPQGFFWVQNKNLADPSKPGIDNLAKAIDLDNPNGGGWAIIASDAAGIRRSRNCRRTRAYFARRRRPRSIHARSRPCLKARTPIQPTGVIWSGTASR